MLKMLVYPTPNTQNVCQRTVGASILSLQKKQIEKERKRKIIV